jgi:LPXTG-site transpeptidase (sortase) family protein
MKNILILVLVFVFAFFPATTSLGSEQALSLLPGNPSRLIIPQIGVDAPVLAMGLTADNSMAVPNNFTDAGWFRLGARPGERGSAVLGAHVDNGGATPGIFKNLKHLAVGDEFEVTDDRGITLRFQVEKVGIYDRRERNTDEIYFRADQARLNLITCHGEWLPAENTYAERLVIFAVLVS